MGFVARLGAKGFRVFFLLAGAHAALTVPLWLLVWSGTIGLRGPLQGMIWHAHEMIFGFTLAVIAGFLLTAAENWTGRPTLRGPALLLVAATWLAARFALALVPGWLGPVLDLAVLPMLIVGLARALLPSRNARNYPFLALLGALWLADVMVYLDAAGVLPGAAVTAHRAAVYVIAGLMLVMTGRVVPMFTRNATGVATIHGDRWLDRLAVGGTVVVAVLQVRPESALLPWAAAVAGVAALARTRGWWTAKILEHPLLWVLHLGHAAIGVGLLLLASQSWLGVPSSTPLHTITVGGIGLLTVGMMARVSLGHTGRPLRVGRAMAVAFGCVAVAVVMRVVGPWAAPAQSMLWLWAAAVSWSAGFGVFAWVYVPILAARRVDGRPG